MTALSWPQGTPVTHEQKLGFDAVSIRQIQAFEQSKTALSVSYVYTRHQPCIYTDDKVLCQLSLEELIKEAWQRKRYELTGPPWLKDNLFVFQGVLAEKTNQANARLMLQHALEERFGLQSHLEKKLLPVYELAAAPGGSHLTPADPPELQKKIALEGHPASSEMSSRGKFSAVAISLDSLGRWIEKIAGTDRPVLNGTGLDDRYKFDLHWEPNDDVDTHGSEQDTGILRALKMQAGLVLQKRNRPIEVLVVDHVNPSPTPN